MGTTVQNFRLSKAAWISIAEIDHLSGDSRCAIEAQIRRFNSDWAFVRRDLRKTKDFLRSIQRDSIGLKDRLDRILNVEDSLLPFGEENSKAFRPQSASRVALDTLEKLSAEIDELTGDIIRYRKEKFYQPSNVIAYFFYQLLLVREKATGKPWPTGSSANVTSGNFPEYLRRSLSAASTDKIDGKLFERALLNAIRGPRK